MRISRTTRVVMLLAVVAAAGYGTVRIAGKGTEVPPAFTDARLEAALIAQRIVTTTSELTKELDRVRMLDEEKRRTEALAVTTELVRKSQNVRAEALALANELERMATALPDIGSDEARDAAFESIQDRLASIGHLVNYSDAFATLLTTIRDKFTGSRGGADVSDIVNQINNEVTAINTLSDQARAAIERFDTIVGGGK